MLPRENSSPPRPLREVHVPHAAGAPWLLIHPGPEIRAYADGLQQSLPPNTHCIIQPHNGVSTAAQLIAADPEISRLLSMGAIENVAQQHFLSPFFHELWPMETDTQPQGLEETT